MLKVRIAMKAYRTYSCHRKDHFRGKTDASSKNVSALHTAGTIRIPPILTVDPTIKQFFTNAHKRVGSQRNISPLTADCLLVNHGKQ